MKRRRPSPEDNSTVEEEAREEAHESMGTAAATTTHPDGDPDDRADVGAHGPQPRLQQTAASKRRRTTSSPSSTSASRRKGDAAMVRANTVKGGGSGVDKLLTKRRRREEPTIGDGDHHASIEYIYVDDIIEEGDHQHRICNKQDDEGEVMTMLPRSAKKFKASSAEAGLISPMRAFADAEAAAAAAAVANGPLGSFAVLPVEIMLHLLSFLSGIDVCHVRLTSSEFNR
jgi:hypothetical protein